MVRMRNVKKVLILLSILMCILLCSCDGEHNLNIQDGSRLLKYRLKVFPEMMCKMQMS